MVGWLVPYGSYQILNDLVGRSVFCVLCCCVKVFSFYVTKVFIDSCFVGSVCLTYILFFAFSTGDEINYIAGFACVFYPCVLSACIATGLL